MKSLLLLCSLIVAGGAILIGCGGGGGSGSYNASGSTSGGTASGSTTSGGAGTTASIPAINNAAAPMGYSFNSPITVKAGTSVTWTNQSTAPHSIIWDAQSPSSSPSPGSNLPVFSPGRIRQRLSRLP